MFQNLECILNTSSSQLVKIRPQNNHCILEYDIFLYMLYISYDLDRTFSIEKKMNLFPRKLSVKND